MDIDVPESVISVGNYAFMGCGLSYLYIPDLLTSIGEGAFMFCHSLHRIIVGIYNNFYDSRNDCNAIIRTVDNCLILGCESTVIPSSVTRIRDDAFRGTLGSYISTINIPSSVTSIGAFAFAQNDNITSITIPASVTDFGIDYQGHYYGYVFYNCSHLSEVYMNPVTPPIGGNYFFEGCSSNLQIKVPAGSVQAYKTASGWSDYADKIVSQ